MKSYILELNQQQTENICTMYVKYVIDVPVLAKVYERINSTCAYIIFLHYMYEKAKCCCLTV